MAKRCMGGYTTTREVYKTVKKYDHQQFDAFCTRVYTNGFNDGKKSVIEKPVRTITDEQLMEVIGEVKGVGPALRGKIKEAIEAKFGSIGNGKKGRGAERNSLLRLSGNLMNNGKGSGKMEATIHFGLME